jgi:hypothetical protein
VFLEFDQTRFDAFGNIAAQLNQSTNVIGGSEFGN